MNPDGDLTGDDMHASLVFYARSCWAYGSHLNIGCASGDRERVPQRESSGLNSSQVAGRRPIPADEYSRIGAAPQATVAHGGFGLLGLVLFMVTTSPTFFRRFVGEATPGTLGAMRVWVCGILLLLTLLEDLPSIAWLPIETRQPQGVMRWLYILPIGSDKPVAAWAVRVCSC